jgi:predicted MFS family arabinose efflux permease
MGNIFQLKYQQPKDVPFEKREAALEIGKKKYQNVGKLTAIVACICMGAFYYGITLSMSSAVSSNVYKAYFGEWASQTLIIGWLVGLYHIGGAFGALLARLLIRPFTRRSFFLVLAIAGIISTGILQVNNIYLLMVMRVVQGFIVGAYMAFVPLYIN